MNYEEVMSTLENMGTEQNRKTYARHGADKNMYGVSTANLIKLQKNIKVDHDLALQLWKTGNLDACILATMIADSRKFTIKQAKEWMKQKHYHFLGSYVAGFISKTSFAKDLMKEWMKSQDEQYRRCGYNILAAILKDRSEEITTEECREYLGIIEKEIHGSPNRARYAMNNSVIAIGTYKLDEEAIETAKRIGKVEVDHGDTSCKTPDAVEYIQKSRARLQKKNQNKSTKTSSNKSLESARRKKSMSTEVSDAKPTKKTATTKTTKAKATKAKAETKAEETTQTKTPKAKKNQAENAKSTETKAKAKKTKPESPKATETKVEVKAKAKKAKTEAPKAEEAKAKTSKAKTAKAKTEDVKPAETPVSKAKTSKAKAKKAEDTKSVEVKAEAKTSKAKKTKAETAKAPKAKATKAKAKK